MSWKPKKEKALTLEEALELARKELEPFWHNSVPMLAGVRAGELAAAYPLEKAFSEKIWAAFAIDPTTYSGEAALACMAEWRERYQPLGLDFLLIFRLPYAPMRTPQLIRQLLKKHYVSFPAVLDADGSLIASFGASTLPKFAVFHHGKLVFHADGPMSAGKWRETEDRLQRFLWTIDPGTAMLPLFDMERLRTEDALVLETGARLPTDAPEDARLARYPAPGFQQAQGGFGVGSFPRTRGGASDDRLITLSGNWVQDVERIATQDPSATLELRCPGTRMGIVAQTLNAELKSVKVLVEVDGKAVYEAISEEHVSLDDEGKSLFRVEGVQFYRLLTHLPSRGSRVTFAFPHADRTPISIFGFRFGE